MQDLKFRFGSILAFALLPLLIFSIWQSYNDYQEDTRMRAALLDDAAVTTVSEVINTIDNVKSILKLFADSVTPETCQTDIDLVLDNFPRISNIILVGSDSSVICAGYPPRSREPIVTALSRITSTKPIDVDLRSFAETSTRPDDVVVVTLGNYVDGRLEQAVRASIDIQVLNNLRARALVPQDVLVSLYSQSADIILGSAREQIDIEQSWTDSAKRDGRYEGPHISQTGEARQLVILPTTEPELFVAISIAQKTRLNSTQLPPLLAAFIPLMAWLLGCLAIWMLTDRLILTHLKTIQTSLTAFTNGDRSANVTLKNKPPSAIAALGGRLNTLMGTVNTREKELNTSLEEKETLLREIHHRVKNNLQIIISLLNMQERKLVDPKGLNALKETKHRINAIALVHKALYEGEDVSAIPMDRFLHQLATQLGRALLTDRMGIKIKTEINCRALDSDRATPVALFIVEAVTNAVKHGVHDGGEILINVSEQDDIITAKVIDSGPGIPTDSVTTGTGSKLMKGFARQLSGTYTTLTRDTGFEASLAFPANTQKSPASHIR